MPSSGNRKKKVHKHKQVQGQSHGKTQNEGHEQHSEADLHGNDAIEDIQLTSTNPLDLAPETSDDITGRTTEMAAHEDSGSTGAAPGRGDQEPVPNRGESESENVTDVENEVGTESKADVENEEALQNATGNMEKVDDSSDHVQHVRTAGDNEYVTADDKSESTNHHKANNDDIGNDDVTDYDSSETGDITDMSCDSLYHKAVGLVDAGRGEVALKLLLRCLSELGTDSGFKFVPQCVRKIAELYHAQGDHDQAIQFLTLERMYYESALVDTSVMQSRIEESMERDDLVAGREGTENPELLRAVEYEHLSKLCLDKKESQLALEFSGKACQIYQTLFGNKHPKTMESLDYFANTYAEAGRVEYSESLRKFEENDTSIVTEESDGASGGTSNKEESEGVRKRRNLNKTEPKQCGGMSSPENNGGKLNLMETTTAEDTTHTDGGFWWGLTLWISFWLLLLLVITMFVYVFCASSPRSVTCHTMRTTLFDWGQYAEFYSLQLLKAAGLR